MQLRLNAGRHSHDFAREEEVSELRGKPPRLLIGLSLLFLGAMLFAAQAAQSTPTLEQTADFISKKLLGCGAFLTGGYFKEYLDSKTGTVSDEFYAWEYQWKRFVLDSKSITWEVVSLAEILTKEATKISQKGVVPLAALSPSVEVRYEEPEAIEKFFVVLRCTSGACIELTERSVRDKHVEIEQDDSNRMTAPEVKKARKVELPVCDGKEEAARLARAFTHLIATGGGQKPLF
jgi:hypothetical protein